MKSTRTMEKPLLLPESSTPTTTSTSSRIASATSSSSTSQSSSSSQSSNYIICNGLRYAIPYDCIGNPIQIKDKLCDELLTKVLATMYRRQRGTQPMEDAIEHWSNEIIGQRVEIRRHHKNKHYTGNPNEEKDRDDHNSTISTAQQQQRRQDYDTDKRNKHHVDRNNKKEDANSDNKWEKATISTKVTRRMLVRFIMHVHELVIPSSPKLLNPIQILWENQDYIVIHKPGGISTTEDNNFGRGVNSLLTILSQQLLSTTRKNDNNNHNTTTTTTPTPMLKLTPAHRLDKPVSGVLLLGKTPGRASTLLKQIQLAESSSSPSSTTTKTTSSKKVYIARIKRHIKSISLVLPRPQRRHQNNNNSNETDINQDNENCVQQQHYAFFNNNNDDDDSTIRDNKSVILDFSSSSSITNNNFPYETFWVQAELGWENKQKRAYVLSNEEAKKQRLHRNACIAGSKRKEMKRNLERQRHQKRQPESSSSNKKQRKQQQQQNSSNDISNSSSISTTVDNSVHDIDRCQVVPPTTTTTTEATTKTTTSTDASTSNNNNNAESGKPDIHTTQFRRISTVPEEDGTILIECRPLTGTRHQIRAHLALIGWPIANDASYLKEKTYNDGKKNDNDDDDDDDDDDILGVVGSSLSSSEGGTKQQQLHAYVDDDLGTLRRTLGLHTRPWCAKCNWTMGMLDPTSSQLQSSSASTSNGTTIVNTDLRLKKNDNVENNPATTTTTTTNATTTLLQRSVIPVQGPIWLHSWRYVLPSVGIDVTAPLPDWAISKEQT